MSVCRKPILAPLFRRIMTVPVNSKRTASPEEMAEACKTANAQAKIAQAGSLAQALQEVSNDEFVVIAGSLYLIGEAMELLGLSSGNAANERKLNEWSGQPIQPKA